MPRIEIVPYTFCELPQQAQDDGTPTIDVCAGCVGRFEEGEDFPELDLYYGEKLGDNLGDLSLPSCTIGSTDVEHPPYDDLPGSYECLVCGERLSQTLDV